MDFVSGKRWIGADEREHRRGCRIGNACKLEFFHNFKDLRSVRTKRIFAARFGFAP
jgi:hypothetical protein